MLANIIETDFDLIIGLPTIKEYDLVFFLQSRFRMRDSAGLMQDRMHRLSAISRSTLPSVALIQDVGGC